MDDKTKKKVLNFIKFMGTVLFFYFLIVILFNYVPFLSRYERFTILSDSMDPVITRGDMIFVNTEYEVDNIGRNDIFAFYVDIDGDGREERVVHYIAVIDQLGDEYVFRTSSEASNALDSWTIQERDLIGQYSFRIPKVGNILNFFGSTFGRIILIFDVIVVYFLYTALFEDEKDESEDIFTDDIDKYNK